MRKVVAALCALALAVSMSAVTFAASTPGQTTPGQATSDSTIQELTENIKANIKNKTLATQYSRQLTAYLSDKNTNAVVTAEAYDAMTLFLETYVSTSEIKQYSFGDETSFMSVAVRSQDNIGVDSLTITGNVLTLNASYRGTPTSGTGALVSVTVPTSSLSDKDYIWSYEGRQIGYVEKISYGDCTMLCFYVPHFSEYVIAPYEEPASSDSTTSSGSTSSTTDSPIKDTGVDMSLSILVLAAGGIAVVGGAAATSRKLRSK